MKSYESELRHLFQCYILIPRKWPHKTLFQHTVPPPPLKSAYVIFEWYLFPRLLRSQIFIHGWSFPALDSLSSPQDEIANGTGQEKSFRHHFLWEIFVTCNQRWLNIRKCYTLVQISTNGCQITPLTTIQLKKRCSGD